MQPRKKFPICEGFVPEKTVQYENTMRIMCSQINLVSIPGARQLLQANWQLIFIQAGLASHSPIDAQNLHHSCSSQHPFRRHLNFEVLGGDSCANAPATNLSRQRSTVTNLFKQTSAGSTLLPKTPQPYTVPRLAIAFVLMSI